MVVGNAEGAPVWTEGGEGEKEDEDGEEEPVVPQADTIADHRAVMVEAQHTAAARRRLTNARVPTAGPGVGGARERR